MMLMYLALDEQMSGWCPNASKLGVLRNRTNEPRKQAPSGTMLKSSEECNAGATFCDEVVQNPEQQSRKKHSKDKASSPNESKFLSRTEEVLRQVESDGLEK